MWESWKELKKEKNFTKFLLVKKLLWMENKEIHQFFTNNQQKSIGERKPFLTKHETEVLKLNNENKIVKKKKIKQKVCIAHLSTYEGSLDLVNDFTHTHFETTDLV
jgi:hypothetical protein